MCRQGSLNFFFCGAVFDPVRRVVVGNSFMVNKSRDIFVTRLSEDGSGTNEVMRDLIPFDVTRKPVFDTERFVYFQEDEGSKFGRLDLDSMSFKKLADAPHEFGDRNGFFMDGNVFCFDVE